MKYLTLFLVLSNVALADWHNHVVKASCGCWKTTLSFFNTDEQKPFSVEKLGERADGAAMLFARFHGEAKMDSPAGKFHLKSAGELSSLLVVSFNQAGWLVAAKAYPIDATITGPFHLEFIDDNTVVAGNGHLTYTYLPAKRYLFPIAYDTAEFLPDYALKFFGKTDLSVAAVLPLPDGDLLVAGGYQGFGADRYALFLQPGGQGAIPLFNFSSDDDFGADLYLARINRAGEAKWAKEIWSRHYAAPAVTLESAKDGEVELRFDPRDDVAIFEPRLAAQTVKGKGTLKASYSWDGKFIGAGAETRLPSPGRTFGELR